MRIAILDDYQSVALKMADWSVLPADTEIVSFSDHIASEDDLVARLQSFDAVSRMRERTPFPRRVLERLPRLKLLLATGRRNGATIDVAAANALGITVCSTGSLPRFPVELTWGLILAHMRKIALEAQSVRDGGWQSGLGNCLSGKTLGVIGLGTIGGPVARIAQAFEMEVLAWSRNMTQEHASLFGAEHTSKKQLLANSDVVTLHVPLTTETTNLIGATELAAMKQSAVLINTSRGEVIDENALIEALSTGTLSGAGLDTFVTEPLALDHPFRRLPNVIATPHIGYVTEENYRVYFGQTVENIEAFLAGKPLRVLTPEVIVQNF